MQACMYDHYGPPEAVPLREAPLPAVRDGELRVRVKATSVTTADWRFRTASFPGVFWLPGRLMLGLLRPRNRVLGMDFSGVVDAVGAGVTRFRVGDAVFGSANWRRLGAHAEYVAIAESEAVVHK